MRERTTSPTTGFIAGAALLLALSCAQTPLTVRMKPAGSSERAAKTAAKQPSKKEASSRLELDDVRTNQSGQQGQMETSRPVASLSAEERARFGNYYALVIGIDEYDSFGDLASARRDARAVADQLRDDYGFDVTLLLDATRSQIIRGLADMRATVRSTDNLLIYYAGHGWVDEGENQGYWLPRDAEPNDSANYISNSDVTAKVRSMDAKHVLVVADSCYSGKISRGLKINRRVPDFYAKIAKKKARLILTSGGVEPVEDGGGQGGHSIFASAFLSALNGRQAKFDGNSLFEEVHEAVRLNSDQTPEYSAIHKSGHAGGDFVFYPLNQ